MWRWGLFLPIMQPMKQTAKWTLGDVVDLEHFLQADADAASGDLAVRDRKLFEGIAGTSGDRGDVTLLLAWIEARRHAEGGAASSPGMALNFGLRILRLALAVVGLVAGGGLALGVIQYRGELPINVVVALGLLALLPFGLSVFSLVALLYGVLRGRSPVGSLGRWLSGTALMRGVAPVVMRAGGGLGADRRERVQSWLAAVRSRGGLYTSVLAWQGFSLSQFFGAAVGLGILAMVVLRGWVADLAFSWQTTASMGAEQLHAFAAWLAFPWTSLGARWAVPTLEQVAGSRVFLKEGVAVLDSGDLQAWWPFLCMAVLFYGLLPRLGLLAAGGLGQRRALRSLSFSDIRCVSLLRRMRGAGLRVESDAQADRAHEQGAAPASAPVADGGVFVVLPREVESREGGGESWRQAVERALSARCEGHLVTALDADAVADEISGIGASLGESDLLLLLEGWRPCTGEVLDFIRSLRSAVRRSRLLRVGLLGRERSDRWAVPVEDELFSAWLRRLGTLGDTHLSVHNLGGEGRG